MVGGMGWATRILLFLLVLVAAAEAKDLYEPAGPFGPKVVSFPWHCAFSPDGKWVAFIDGHTSYFTIWDFAARKEVWRGAPPRGAHQVAWSKDSKRVATVTQDAFVVVESSEAGWKVLHSVPLGFKTTISKRTSPSPLSVVPNVTRVMFVDGGSVYGISADKEQDVRNATTRGETCHWVLDLGDGHVALAKTKPFGTTVLHPPPQGHTRLKAILLASSRDRSRWLVAPNPKRLDTGKRADVEIIEARTGKRIKAFRISGGAHRPLVYAAFSPDGSLLATVEGSGEIVLRDAGTAKARQKIREYKKERYAMGVAFSPNGGWLITGGRRKDKESSDHGTLLWKRVGD